MKVIRLDTLLVDATLQALVGQYDSQYGGFGFDPARANQSKFPEPPNLVFLLDYSRRHKSRTAQSMLTETLEQISRGGIRDHVGGGFHRYSTDRRWRVPHFEKMLYDNGQLASVYAQAYEQTPREDFKRVVDETLEFILREMTDADGGFYSALDAETDAQEGRYYVWTRQEVEQSLPPDGFALWAGVYGLTGEPNFEGHYIPLLAKSIADEAQARGLQEAALNEKLQAARAKLLAERGKRPRPLCDTKILAGWNGLMIRGLADAGRVFHNEQYTAAAIRSADFVLTRMRNPAGRLQRTFAGGQAKLLGYLDDYALLVDGLIAWHRTPTLDRAALAQPPPAS